MGLVHNAHKTFWLSGRILMMIEILCGTIRQLREKAWTGLVFSEPTPCDYICGAHWRTFTSRILWRSRSWRRVVVKLVYRFPGTHYRESLTISFFVCNMCVAWKLHILHLFWCDTAYLLYCRLYNHLSTQLLLKFWGFCIRISQF